MPAVNAQCRACPTGGNTITGALSIPPAFLPCTRSCRAGFFHSLLPPVGCTACSPPAGVQCAAGYAPNASSCAGDKDTACAPCAPPLDASLDLATRNCSWTCLPGYFRTPAGFCLSCSAGACPAGAYRDVCTPQHDASCLACAPGPRNASLTAAAVPGADTCGFLCDAGPLTVLHANKCQPSCTLIIPHHPTLS